MTAAAMRREADLWDLRACDCAADEHITGPRHARFLLGVHSGHGGACRPYQAALRVVRS
ncbi:hypothetical protein [Nocardia sp. CNY236]|uniref:hypothetical protein n=1 Tax=Nocardia sp. CNY236 TaxID=1169152 RepID=UPI0004052FA8|nr:hypothetical protein [Nocardia sp. CNY236]